MKTILITFLTESPISFLLLCILLSIASYCTGLYLRAIREKELKQRIIRIKESHADEITLCKEALSKRKYQEKRKSQIVSALISFLEEAPFDFSTDPLQTAKDVVRFYAIVVAAELASCEEIDGRMTDYIKKVFEVMERLPYKLPEESDTQFALKVIIRASMRKNQKPS